MTFLDDFFKYYVERGRDPYPRGYLRLYPDHQRLQAASREDLITAMYISKDMFINIFSEFQRRERDYDMLVLDIDDKSIETAFYKLQYCLGKLEENGVQHYEVAFSGSKGFHVYIHFENTRLNNYRHATQKWLESIGILKYVDQKILEPNRVIRIPETMNTKSGLYCYFVGNETVMKIVTFNAIIMLAKNRKPLGGLSPLDTNVGLGMRIAQFDSTELHNSGDMHPSQNNSAFTNEKFYPPCIRRLISLCRDNVDINHNERVELAKFLILNGLSDEEIKTFYMGLSDYKETVTMYQISYLRDRALKMSGCDKMTDMGICCKSHSECPFYPSINKFINIKT